MNNETGAINDINKISRLIKEINPKFKEGSKNYETTKELVTETLAKYENALIELSEFYDGKIEQLILRKVELEAGLIGSLLNEEYLRQVHEIKAKQKESDKVKKSVKENIKSVFEKLKNRKKENNFDPRLMAQLMDEQDVEHEIEDQITKGLEKSEEDKKINKEFIEKYFAIYPEIKVFLDSLVKDATNSGYSKTLYGRRRYIPELASSNHALKKFGERTSMNAPIQGTAADVIKLAMVKVQEKLDELKLNSKIVAQVHDELIIDTKKEEIEIVKKILKEEMENVVNLKVKLDVDVEVGSTWDLK